jgi:hypothetical protein
MDSKLIAVQFSRRFGFLDRGEDENNLFGAIHQYLVYCANVGVINEWHSLLYKVLPWIPGSSGRSYMTQFSAQQLQEKIRETKSGGVGDAGRGDFLTRLWSMHEKDPGKIGHGTMMSVCLTNIGAGSDTTSISLSAILYHVFKNPACLEKVSKFTIFPPKATLVQDTKGRTAQSRDRHSCCREPTSRGYPPICGRTKDALLASLHQRGPSYASCYWTATSPGCSQRGSSDCWPPLSCRNGGRSECMGRTQEY